MPKPPAKTTLPATTQARPIDRFKQQLSLAAPTIMKMVPAHISVDKFQAMVVTAVAYNPDLLDCTTASLLRATAQAAELGLSLNPSLKEADILPVWNKKANGGQGANEAQMRPRYGGMMKLARQSGDIKKIESVVVFERDHFKEVRGTQERLEHEPYQPKPRKRVITDLWKSLGREPEKDEIDAELDKHSPGFKTHVYCTWELTDGTKQFEVMKADDVERIRDRSPAGKAGPWVSDEDEMWRKTVVRRASKYMPMSSETFKRAVDIDNRADSDDPFAGPVFEDEIVDVTAGPGATAGKAQADALADKVAANGAEKKVEPVVAEPPKLLPPDGFDGPDYFQWQENITNLTAVMTPPKRKEFLKAHADIIAAAPKEVADAVRNLAG